LGYILAYVVCISSSKGNWAMNNPFETDAAYLEEHFPEMEQDGMSAALQIFLEAMDDD